MPDAPQGSDQTLVCVDCGAQFTFSARDQSFYQERGYQAPRRHFAVLLLAHEVQLGGADVAVAGELAHLMHRRPVADGVVDRRRERRVSVRAMIA